MWLITQLLWFGCFVSAAAPWLPLVLSRRPSLPEWLAYSGGFGFLLSMLLGWLALELDLGQGAVVVGLAVILIAGLSACCWVWPKAAPVSQPFGWRVGLLVVAGICISLLPRFYFQLKFGAWPRGWDPMFHLSLIKAMELQQGIPWTLKPLEMVHVNYPWGTHLSVIVLARLSGVFPHVAFAAQNSVILSLLTMFAILFFSWRCFSNPWISLWSMLILANVMHYGGSDYQNWGGLPNHAGMMVFLLSFGLLVSWRSLRERWLGILFLGAGFYVHHHIMLSGLCVLGFHFAILAITQRSTRPLLRVGFDVGCALILAAFITIPFLLRLGDVGQTTMLKSREPLDWLSMWRDFPGIPGLVLGVLGVILLRKSPGSFALAPLSFLASMLLMFAILGGMWRIITQMVYGEAFVAMTPSRFITNASNPMAVLAGVAIAKLIAWNRKNIVPILLLLLIVFGEQWIWMKHRDRENAPNQQTIQAVIEIAPAIPADAVVIARFPGDGFAPYLLGRECMITPRPVSETIDSRIEKKKAFNAMLSEGKLDRKLRRELFGQRPIWMVTDRRLPEGFVEKAVWGNVRAGLLVHEPVEIDP